MTQNSFKFAITGGIGSGKSTVANIIKRQGLPVYSCDEIYSELLENKQFIGKLASEFEGILLPDGKLNRSKLSEIVFNNEDGLKKLNSLTHPAIMEKLLKKCSAHKLSFAEVPLLFENGFEEYFDGVLVILRSEEERINSIVARDKISRNEAILRIKSQFDYQNEDFTKYYVIHNSGNISQLEQKAHSIMSDIITKTGAIL